MRERVRRSRVGEVVGRHVDRLHGGHRAGPRRGDPLLELAHLRRERRLVADGARHAAEERRDLGAGLDEAEDVVDEEQHVLALVAEVLRHRQPGERDAEARSRRLVHLAVDERDLVEHAGLGHLEQEVVPLARALADAREHGHAAVLLRDVVDQLLDEDGLADAGAAEEADLAALHVRRDEVDDLDARSRTSRSSERGRGTRAGRGGSTSARCRPGSARARRSGRRSRSRAARGSARRRERRSACPCRRTSTPRARPSVESIATARTRSSPRCCCTSATSVRRRVALADLDLEGGVDLGKLVGEDGVDDDALDLDDPARVRAV